jgi:chemosensory pili system protein ChpA (sensor histidine kinase/response regulator)
MGGEFDIGPLTWVRGEIDQALERSRASLRTYAANPAESNQIKFAQTHFHQAHGALQIVGLDGVTRLSEELEGLLAELEKAGGAPAPEAVRAAEAAYAAISAFLDQLLSGGENQPLMLFAVYRDLVAARGKGQADPIDLYFPDISPRPPRRDKPLAPLAADGAPAFYRDARSRYQRGLLKWIKKDASGAEDMRAAVAAVEGVQAQNAQRAFWWVALGFFDALVAKALPDSPFIARLANRIEQQIKRMSEGSVVVAERLMREALFAVARARPATEHLRAVHEIFALAGSIPAAFELKSESAPQHPALKALREAVPNAKAAWNKAASGHQPSLAAFRDHAGALRDRAGELGENHLAVLVRQLAELATWVADDAGKVTDAVAMEVATALLLVENAVENFSRLQPEFGHQAEAMGARLDACRRGGMPKGAPEVPLLDEMSRRAQERLLMAQVVAEIQTNLRTIEQALDAFFRDPAKRAELAGLEKPVRQVLGALTMLNEDRAAAALATCGQDIQRFAADGYAPEQDDFERVAGTLSGLGFYVDALQHGRADFDAVMKPIAPRREAPAMPVEEAQAVTVPTGSTVEAELERVKKELPSLYEAWKAKPDDAVLKEALKAGLAAIQKDAGFVANAGVESRAGEALAILATSGVLPIDPALVRSISAIAPAVVAAPAPSPETAKLIEASAETVDAELLSVYLEEAGEVLATISSHAEEARAQPQNVETLRTIRRGFHTLKGSGRMVGLTRLGEAAWAVEQVMNKWLEEERPGTADLFALIAHAHAFFDQAVQRLKAGEAGPDEAAVVAMAQRVKAGEPLGDAALPAASEPAPALPVELSAPATAASEPMPEIAPPESVLEPVAEVPADIAITAGEAAAPVHFGPAAETLAPLLPDFDLPELPVAREPEPLPQTAESGPLLDFDLPDFSAAASAAAETIEAEPAPALVEAHAAHELVEAHAAPELVEAHAAPEPDAEPESDDAIVIGATRLSPALYEIFLGESRQHLDGMRGAVVRLGGGQPVAEEFMRSAHTLAGIAGTVRFDAMRALGQAVEHLLERSLHRPVDTPGHAILGEAVGALERMVADAAERRLPDGAPDLVARLDTYTAPASGDAGPPGATLSFELPAVADVSEAQPAEDLLPDLDLTALAEQPAPDQTEAALVDLDLAQVRFDTPAAPATALAEPAPDAGPAAVPEPPSNVVAFPAAAAEPEAPLVEVEVEEIPVERRTRRIEDDIDAQLLPIFMEEAQELVPAVGQTLRDWREHPENHAAGHALQRVLHTLKGSARMCGAMALGELTHSMETRVENALTLRDVPANLFEGLETSYDRMGLLFDRLQNPDAAAEPIALDLEDAESTAAAPAAEAEVARPEAAAAEPAPAPAAGVAEPAPAPAAPRPEAETAAQARAMLRVRADMVDRLVNEAGEVSIARSRIEGELRALKGALSDLTENVTRLRAQLREIEIAAESQMQSRLSAAQETEKPFDPLEFDRFTRFQEITRMMAESVNDVSTVQQNVLKALGDSDAALLAQSRITRELQNNLMRVRMVPFASISERLFRVVRQAAKDAGKRAVLDIRGGQVELDRSVLERITAPFEHMLRNSVAHGIESMADRARAGKPELGEIRIEVRQEGNEVTLAVTDDGGGINVDRVREKAIALGLLSAVDAPPDSEVAELIFHPGFSTAAEVTQLSGRGVGMDVVKSEISALGGRVETHTERGRGTTFTIYLPLTLAVTQAVIVRAGTGKYAVPSAMIEQVRQVKEKELADLNVTGEAVWQERRFPFRYLPRLFADAATQPEPRRVTPVLFLRSGSNILAIQVDEMYGNQEIVVKNTGPLLARVAGITGATVLGSGEILLIVNPVILAGREGAAAHEPVMPSVPVDVTQAVPVNTTPTIMIVDDSLTVRKITGRLLAREGYNVLTAKDGVDAMEQLQDVVPDVMLVDIEMPRMDGFDLTRNVRADRRLRRIPIIMITSRTAEKHRAYAREIGVNVYLGKPYQEDELLSNIAGFVKRAAVLQ